MPKEKKNVKAWGTHSNVTSIGEIDWPAVSCRLEKNGKLACCNRKEEQQEEHAEPVTDFGEIVAELQVLFQIDHRIRVLLQKLAIVIKVDNLQIADQVEEHAGRQYDRRQVHPWHDGSEKYNAGSPNWFLQDVGEAEEFPGDLHNKARHYPPCKSAEEVLWQGLQHLSTENWIYQSS